MIGQQISHTKLVGLALAGILGASTGAVVASIAPANPSGPERADQAATERYQGLAEAYRQQRADEAAALRLDGQRLMRVWDAWSGRLNGLADEQDLRGAPPRAWQAWTDRLNGLAEAHAEAR